MEIEVGKKFIAIFIMGHASEKEEQTIFYVHKQTSDK